MLKSKNYQKLYIGLIDIFNILIILISILYLFYKSKYLIGIDGDFSGYTYSILSGIAQSMAHGEIRLWTPNIWSGITGLHNYCQPFYPLTLIICKIFYNSSTGLLSLYSVYVLYILHIFILCLGFYILLRTVKIRQEICLLAILIGVFSGSTFFFNAWILNFCSFAWLPWIILTIKESAKFDKKIINKYTIFSALLIGLTLLQGLSQSAVLVMILIAIFCLTILFEYITDINKIKELICKYLVILLIGIGISMIFILPVILLGKQNIRFINGDIGYLLNGQKIPYDAFTKEIVTVDNLKNLLGSYYGYFSIGIPTLLFTIIGFFVKVKDNKEHSELLNYGKIVIVISIFTSFAFITTDFLYYIPFANNLREPYLYVYLFFIGITLTCAFGGEYLFNALKNFKNFTQYFYNPKLMCIIILIVSLIPIIPRNFKLNKSNVFALLTFIFIISIIILTNKLNTTKYTNRLLLLIAILICGIFNVNEVKLHTMNIGKYTTEEAVKQCETVQKSVLKIYNKLGYPNDENIYRIMTWGNFQVLSNNIMIDIDGYSTIGYWNPIYKKVIYAHNGLEQNTKAMMQNVKYWIVSSEESQGYLASMEACGFTKYCSIDGIYNNYDADKPETVLVYKNSNYVGEAWLIHNYALVDRNSNYTDLYKLINSGTINLKDTALITDNYKNIVTGIENLGTTNEVKVLSYKHNKIRLLCKNDTPALLVIAENDAPGWNAYVDGKEAKIITVNYSQKAIKVEPGTHNIKFIYCPKSLLMGIFISLSSICFCIIELLLLASNKLSKNLNSKEKNIED